ncbi:MAG: nicotinamide riboside transporter PnuC [Bacteroidota bacterium]
MEFSILKLLEIIGLISGILYVILASRENIWCWPVGILGSIATMIVTYQSKLYLDAGLFVYYILIGFYGWYLWSGRNKTQKILTISQISVTLLVMLVILGVIFTTGLGQLLALYTDASIPYWDAFTTGFSLVATYMQAKKFLENWILWIIVDAIYIGVYFYKDLQYLAILSIFYTVLAVYGFINWRKVYLKATT